MAEPGAAEERKRLSRRISTAYGLAALFAGAALGGIYGLASGDWTQFGTWLALWITVGLVVLTLVALGAAQVLSRRRDREDQRKEQEDRAREERIRRNGTAYFIAEYAAGWQKSRDRGFLRKVRPEFERVVPLAGPYQLDEWKWPLDARARLWEPKMDDLVRAFQVLDYDVQFADNGGTGDHPAKPGPDNPSGVFIWASWPVAVAFGMRVTYVHRDAELDVWQRDSFGRAETVRAEAGQGPHRFGALSTPPDPGGLRLVEKSHEIDLTATVRGQGRPSPDDGHAIVLLIRFGSDKWGPLPPPGDEVDGERLEMAIHDAAGVTPAGTSRTHIHEFRCVPPSGGQFDWADYPALVTEASAWVERKNKEFPGRIKLLGTAVPQEVGLGLGILAGQEARRETWPRDLWPIVFDPVTRRDLVVPDLQLGTSALRDQAGGE